MEYFRYTLQFLNTITFTSSTYTELDNFLNGVVKGYLNHNFGFLPIAPTEDELDELADEIGASYDLMLNDIKPRYEEVLRLGTVHTFRSKDTTKSEYGAENRTGKYYEPVVSNAQAEVKTNGENTTWGDDKTTLDREEDRVLSESAIKDFFKEIKEEVELYFIDFVNIYADGTGCQKPYTLEQLQAINSGIDATKVAQIETNKNNIAQLSNPNLLINGDFRVNQRGQVSYNAYGYTVDRWLLGGTGIEITPINNGLQIVRTSSANLSQRIELPFESLAGKTVTISCSINGIVYSKSGTVPSSQPASDSSTISLNLNNLGYLSLITKGTGSSYGYNVYFSNQSSYTINWVKLELGSVATPFNPRPYAEELSICQRYYLKAKLHGMGATAYNTTLFYPFLNTPTSLKTAPTITIITAPKVRGQGSNNLGTTNDIVIQNTNSNGCTLKVTHTSLSVGYFYEIADGNCELDAEIY